MSFFSGSLFGYSWKSRLIVLAVNIAGIGLFLSLGILVDRTYNTAPAFMLLGLFASFPPVQIITARILLRRHQSSDGRSSQPPA